MRVGINYDTGVFPGGRKSRLVFDPAEVEFDMKVIARDLHCSAVRITGGDAERLTVAAEYALAQGLEVWFSPLPCESDANEVLAVFRDSAMRAEALHRRYVRDVRLVLGCEISVFARGFLPGAETVEEGAREAVRVALLGPDGPTGTFTHAKLGTLPW